MPKYYYVIKCTRRGLEEEDLECIASRRDYHEAREEVDDLNANFDKPSYIHYYVSQYRNGKG
jgi:hypothetical protein